MKKNTSINKVLEDNDLKGVREEAWNCLELVKSCVSQHSSSINGSSHIFKREVLTWQLTVATWSTLQRSGQDTNPNDSLHGLQLQPILITVQHLLQVLMSETKNAQMTNAFSNTTELLIIATYTICGEQSLGCINVWQINLPLVLVSKKCSTHNQWGLHLICND